MSIKWRASFSFLDWDFFLKIVQIKLLSNSTYNIFIEFLPFELSLAQTFFNFLLRSQRGEPVAYFVHITVCIVIVWQFYVCCCCCCYVDSISAWCFRMYCSVRIKELNFSEDCKWLEAITAVAINGNNKLEWFYAVAVTSKMKINMKPNFIINLTGFLSFLRISSFIYVHIKWTLHALISIQAVSTGRHQSSHINCFREVFFVLKTNGAAHICK